MFIHETISVVGYFSNIVHASGTITYILQIVQTGQNWMKYVHMEH